MRRLAWLLLAGAAFAQQSSAPAPAGSAPPRVLIVVAHPDDESCFAATTYRGPQPLGRDSGDQELLLGGDRLQQLR